MNNDEEKNFLSSLAAQNEAPRPVFDAADTERRLESLNQLISMANSGVSLLRGESGPEILDAYYAAMNAHDSLKAIGFLCDDVTVTFPEAERNWAGKGNASDKFGGMFIRMPSFNGNYVLQDLECSRNDDGALVQIIRAVCRFVCEQTNSDSTREMRYTIVNGAISKIEHL